MKNKKKSVDELKKIPLEEMTMEAAIRIQKAEAKDNGGKIEKDGFAARAIRAAQKNEANNS